MKIQLFDLLHNIEIDSSYKAKILVICHTKFIDTSRIERYITEWHGDFLVYFVSAYHLLNYDGELDSVFKNMDKFSYFYITTDSKDWRKTIRKKIKDKTGKDIHIKKYSKLVNLVDRNNMRK